MAISVRRKYLFTGISTNIHAAERAYIHLRAKMKISFLLD